MIFQVWGSFIQTSENHYVWASVHSQHSLPVCSSLRTLLGTGNKHKVVFWGLTINITSGHQRERGRKGPMVMFISWIPGLLPISSTPSNSLYEFPKSDSANIEFQIVDMWLIYKQSSALHFFPLLCNLFQSGCLFPLQVLENINQFYHSAKHQKTGSLLKVGNHVILFCVRHPTQYPAGAP